MATRALWTRMAAGPILLAALALALAGCDLLPGDSDVSANDLLGTDEQTLIEIGEKRSSITARLGEPAEQMSWTKQDEVIFGPIETFWSEVPLGAAIEIWRFPIEDAWFEAYFVDGSDTVQGTAIAPKDAVY